MKKSEKESILYELRKNKVFMAQLGVEEAGDLIQEVLKSEDQEEIKNLIINARDSLNNVLDDLNQ